VSAVTEALGHLGAQHALEHVLRQPVQYAVRAHQVDTPLLDLGQKLLGELL